MVAYKKRIVQQPSITPEEYLERERKAETKSEYYGGVVVAMAGASKEHNRITANIYGELHGQLRRSPCQAFVADLRVSASACDTYFYPDIVAVCGEPRFADEELDTLLNPTLIVEVLSDSTKEKDRGEKMDCYQTLESLQTYILIEQGRPHVKIYRRQENGWHYSTVEGLENSLTLEAIGCDLKLADIYDRVQFPEKEAVSKADEAAKERLPGD